MDFVAKALLVLSLVVFVYGDAGAWKVTRQHSLPEHDLNVALRQATDHFARQQTLENNLKVSDIDVEEKSPSHGQLIDGLPSAEALLHGATAELATWASAYLLHGFCRRQRIPRDECLSSMSGWSLNTTAYRRKCAVQYGTSSCAASRAFASFDGACNHPDRPTLGQAYSPYLRLLTPAYADGISEARTRSVSRKALPSAREVSSELMPDLDRPDKTTTLAVPHWGLFIANDLFQTVLSRARHTGNSIECCRSNGKMQSPRYVHPDCMPITIPTTDPDYSPYYAVCMNYVRSLTTLPNDCTLGPAQQMNQASHYLDGSMLYGNSLPKSLSLRAMSGGRLATSGSSPQEEFLPLAQAPELHCQNHDNATICYTSGDSRVNQQPQQTAMYTVWLRQHNRIADALSALNPHWGDKKTFMEARSIVIAQMQHITYKHWLPVILGEQYAKKTGLAVDDEGFGGPYNEETDPSVSNAVATAGFAFINSLLSKDIRLYDEGRGQSSRVLQLQEHFHRPGVVQQPGVFDSLVRGLAVQAAQKMDASIVDDVTSKLYRGSRPFGLDAVSVDIQRGRDHGLPPYTAYRRLCRLHTSTKFDTFSEMDIPRSSINKLKSLYAHPDDVDLVTGVLLETPADGAVVGRTLQCLLGDQFQRSRQGDRFFYDLDGLPHSFTEEQMNEMKKSTLARVLCDNAEGVTGMQLNVFRAESTKNHLVECTDPRIPSIDLSFWADH